MGELGACFTPQVLEERATQIDIQDLTTVTYCKDGLSPLESVLQNRTVGLLAKQVGGSRLTLILAPVFLRLNVCRASRKHEAVEGR